MNTTKIRTAVAVAVAAVACSALAMPAVANAAGSAKTKVTIKAPNGEYSGTVKSTNPALCAEGREVRVFKLLADGPHLIASDTASLNGNRYEWSTGNTGAGDGTYFAKVAKIPGCKGATSKQVNVQLAP